MPSESLNFLVESSANKTITTPRHETVIKWFHWKKNTIDKFTFTLSLVCAYTCSQKPLFKGTIAVFRLINAIHSHQDQARIQKMLNRGAQTVWIIRVNRGGGGGANLFFGLTYKGEQGGVRRVRPPLNPRLKTNSIFLYFQTRDENLAWDRHNLKPKLPSLTTLLFFISRDWMII